MILTLSVKLQAELTSHSVYVPLFESTRAARNIAVVWLESPYVVISASYKAF